MAPPDGTRRRVLAVHWMLHDASLSVGTHSGAACVRGWIRAHSDCSRNWCGIELHCATRRYRVRGTERRYSPLLSCDGAGTAAWCSTMCGARRRVPCPLRPPRCARRAPGGQLGALVGRSHLCGGAAGDRGTCRAWLPVHALLYLIPTVQASDELASVGYTAGRVNQNVAPSPGVESTSITPPCAITTCLTIASPSPVLFSPPVGRAESLLNS